MVAVYLVDFGARLVRLRSTLSEPGVIGEHHDCTESQAVALVGCATGLVLGSWNLIAFWLNPPDDSVAGMLIVYGRCSSAGVWPASSRRAAPGG